MKIKLIAPARKPEWGESFWDFKSLCAFTGKKASGAPLALPTLAALTPPDVEVVLTDENVESVDFDEHVDLVGITGMTSVIQRSYEIADEYRKRGVPVVMGGIHVSMLPEEAIQHADAVVIGEAEEVWGQVVRDAQRHCLQQVYRAPRFPDLTSAPLPQWDLLKNDRYSFFTIQTGRGCPFDCEFCCVKEFNGKQYRHKPIEHVMKEVEKLLLLDHHKLLFFTDDNFLAVPAYAQDLCARLARLTYKNWICQASMNRLRDARSLSFLREGGCRAVFVGIESISQASLHAMNKQQVNCVAEYKDIVRNVHDQGIMMFGSFILGSDSDTERVFDDTIAFIKECEILFPMINVLTLFPGTKLYERMKNEKRLEPFSWWQANGDCVVFKPKQMSKRMLEQGHKKVLREVYSFERMYERLRGAWDKGICITKKENRYSLARWALTLYALRCLNFPKAFFLLRSLWYRKKVTSILWVLVALNYHGYAGNSQKKKRCKGISPTQPPHIVKPA